jgi:hypothetical protein
MVVSLITVSERSVWGVHLPATAATVACATAFTLQPAIVDDVLAAGLHEAFIDMEVIASLQPLPWRACFQGEGAVPHEKADTSVPVFGAQDSTRWTIKGQWGRAFHDRADEYGGALGLQYFIVDGFAFAPELNLWGISQDDDNAFGVSLDLVFQWHFLRRDTWSLFGDFGCGLLGTSSNVPSLGSQFNFTPQAGLGVTWAIGDAGRRAVVGLKWHHVSNASLYRSNPGRDTLLVYGGLSLPF